MPLTIWRSDCQTSYPSQGAEAPCRFCRSSSQDFRCLDLKNWILLDSLVDSFPGSHPACLLLASLGVHRRGDQYSTHPGSAQPPIGRGRHSKRGAARTILSSESLWSKYLSKQGGRYPITQRAFMVTVLEYREVPLLLVSLCQGESMQAFRKPLNESSCIFAKAVVGAPCSCSHQPVSLVITGAAGRRFTLSLQIQTFQVQTAEPRQFTELLLLCCLCRFSNIVKLYSSCSEMAAQGGRSRYSMMNPMVIEEGGAIRLRTQFVVSAT